jgi:CheY-like chemotaxis protein
MTHRPRILLIDDDHDFIEATIAVLESTCDLDVAYDGETGLSHARQALPDLVILDVIMPGVDGFEVCEQIKADPTLAGVPVILLTSLPDGAKPSGVLGAAPCAEGYLEKPVRPAELLRQVGKFLAQRVQENQ